MQHQRMTDQEIIDVVKARMEGKMIQARVLALDADVWDDWPCPLWNFESMAYRVKPEPRVMWINRYSDIGYAYTSRADAERCKSRDPSVQTVKFIEVLEGE